MKMISFAPNPLRILLVAAAVVLGSALPAAEPGSGAVRPVPLKTPLPDYPDELAYHRLTGEVIVEFIVDAEGRVVNPVVIASNNPWFERAALTAILKWTYRPGEVDGKKTEMRFRQELRFVMKSGFGRDMWQWRGKQDNESLPEHYRWTQPPEPVNTTFAVYPRAALQAGMKGKARINFVVGPNGRVVDAAVVESVQPEFGAAMLAMIDTWIFTPPAKKDGTPCYALLSMQYAFAPAHLGEVPVTAATRRVLKALEKTPEKIIELTALDRPPKPLSRRPPVYPSALLASRTRGSAVVEFFIDEEGDVQLPAIVSSTAPAFGYAAVQAIATWRFDRPLRHGKPVIARVSIPLDYEP